MFAKAPGGCFPSHLHLSLLLVLVQTSHPLSKYDRDDGDDGDDRDDYDSGDDDDGDDNIFIMATSFTTTMLCRLFSGIRLRITLCVQICNR